MLWNGWDGWDGWLSMIFCQTESMKDHGGPAICCQSASASARMLPRNSNKFIDDKLL